MSEQGCLLAVQEISSQQEAASAEGGAQPMETEDVSSRNVGTSGGAARSSLTKALICAQCAASHFVLL